MTVAIIKFPDEAKATAFDPSGPEFCGGELLTDQDQPQPYKAYNDIKNLRNMSTMVNIKDQDKRPPGFHPLADKYTVTLTISGNLSLNTGLVSDGGSYFPPNNQQVEVYEGKLTLRWEKHQFTISTPEVLGGESEIKTPDEIFIELAEESEERIREDTFDATIQLRFHVCEGDSGTQPIESDRYATIFGEMESQDELREAPWPWNGKKLKASFKADNPLREQEGDPPQSVSFKIYDFVLKTVSV